MEIDGKKTECERENASESSRMHEMNYFLSPVFFLFVLFCFLFPKNVIRNDSVSVPVRWRINGIP